MRVLRRRRRSRSRAAFSNKHQIANVYQRVRQVRQYANGVSSENKIQAHDQAASDAPIPERYRDDAFPLPFGRKPLDKKTHREKDVPDEAKDHDITPIQTEEPVFFPDPRDGDKCECVHSMWLFNVSPLPSQGRGYSEGFVSACC